MAERPVVLEHRDARRRCDEACRLCPDALLDSRHVQAPVFEGGEEQGGREGLGIGRDPGQGLRHRTAVCAAGRVEIVGLDQRRGLAHHLGTIGLNQYWAHRW